MEKAGCKEPENCSGSRHCHSGIRGAWIKVFCHGRYHNGTEHRKYQERDLKTAVERGLAFLCALLLAAGCFGVFGYTLPGFTVYLLLFALLCLCVGWGAAIAMDSVLITHFLGEQSMAPVFLLNEVLLFFIGTGMGILVNMHLHRKEADFRRLSDEVDSQIKGILHRMSLWLPREDKSEYGSGCFEKLDKALEEARLCAAANYNNSVLERNPRELDYIEMREKQSIILKGIYENIKSITFLPEQAKQVAELFGKIEEDYHRENTVEELLNSLGKLLEEMKQQELPASREEFEARAILFYILMQTESFLNLKRDYMLRNGFL